MNLGGIRNENLFENGSHSASASFKPKRQNNSIEEHYQHSRRTHFM